MSTNNFEDSPATGHITGPDAALSAEAILARSHRGGYCIRVYDMLDSTNTELKRLAAEGAPEGTVVIAQAQNAGRGRLGRSFFSPADTGLYMSLLLRPSRPISGLLSMTACAAVAAAQAIETVTGERAAIKWVNDVYLRGRKVCGILAEGAVDAATGALASVVLGIGINIDPPQGGFPAELQDTAGALTVQGSGPEIRSQLAADFLDRFMSCYEDTDADSLYDAYVLRSMVLGRDVTVLAPGRAPVRAQALGIGKDFSLELQTVDGSAMRLCSGEISIRPDVGQSWE